MRALFLNCTLKPSPPESNTERLAGVVTKRVLEPSYGDTDHGHEWSHTTGRAAAQNLLATARALAASPIPAPPS
jgi:hypothetical protein